MKKELYSGNCFMGTCGEPTDLFDSFGKQLSIGDLVVIYNVEHNREISAEGLEYIVHPDGEEPFIMGLKNCKKETHYCHDGEESSEGLYDRKEDTYDSGRGFMWIVRKVKGYEKTVDGEIWGSGNVTVRSGRQIGRASCRERV